MSRIVVAAAIIFVCLGSGAAKAADKTLWFVDVEGMAMQAGGEDLVMGTPASPVTGGPDGDLVTLTYDTAGAWKVGVGAARQESAYSISYFGYSKSTDKSVQSADGYLPAFENPLFGDSFANRLDGEAKLQVSIVDALWTRAMASGGKSHWNWIVGLRYSKVDRDATMTDDPTASGYDDQTSMTSKASGIGIVGGVGGRYDCTAKVALTASMKLALLAGTMDVTRDENAFGVPLRSELSGKDRTFRQNEIDARVHWLVNPHVDLSLGYQFVQLDRAVGRLVLPSDTANGLVTNETSDIALNGFVIGGKFTF